MYSCFSLPCSDYFSYRVQSPVYGCFPTETHATELSAGHPDLHHSSLRLFPYATLAWVRLTVKLSVYYTESHYRAQNLLPKLPNFGIIGCIFILGWITTSDSLHIIYYWLKALPVRWGVAATLDVNVLFLQLLLCFLRELSEIAFQNAFLLQCLASDDSSKCGKADIPLFWLHLLF